MTVDWHGSQKVGSRKVVLQYYSSTFAVLWDRVGAAGVSCPDPVIWKFPFLGGAVGGGWKKYIVM